MTAETGEFNVYKPGDIVDFYATKKAYVEGFQMQRKDFSCTYCYKDKNGNIGIQTPVTKLGLVIIQEVLTIHLSQY